MTRRPKNAEATRDALLASARRRFLEESYENVGLREIAGDAGVDVALVSRYFGSKEGLFREVVRKARGEWLNPDICPARLPAWLAELTTREDSDGADIERLLIILRSVSSPKAARIVKESFREDVLDPVAKLLAGDDPEMRASLALSLLLGTTVLRTIMRVDAICECDTDAVRRRLEALLAEALRER
ncbi:MAG TPA: TetR family transcriptional regulator [Allosphingosinicella sp.]|nr:TetR family transcriptional regulator [Allosphingosinicella sp.]